jgi:type I restriction enzyme S subunit
MIELEDHSLQLVRTLLAQHLPGWEVRLFGSRVRGTARKYSDIDLVVVGASAVPEQTLTALRDAFADSDLPYKVDLLDWQSITPEFRKVIETQGFERIQSSQNIK